MGRVRTEKLPKYSSVALSLLERIQFDEFAGENILPSEAQLMKQYAVSRTTGRWASWNSRTIFIDIMEKAPL